MKDSGVGRTTAAADRAAFAAAAAARVKESLGDENAAATRTCLYSVSKANSDIVVVGDHL